jgi:hypothetical protein
MSSFLLFSLIQRSDIEYLIDEKYQIVELVDKDHPIRGYSLCDEHGRTDYLPSANSNSESWFLPANEDTELAWIGKKKWSEGKEFFVVTLDPNCREEIETLMIERQRR